jgi:hypothetical protein
MPLDPKKPIKVHFTLKELRELKHRANLCDISISGYVKMVVRQHLKGGRVDKEPQG